MKRLRIVILTLIVLLAFVFIGTDINAADALAYNVDNETKTELSTGAEMYSNDIMTVVANRKLTPTTNKSSATSEDSAYTFTKGLLPGGNCNSTANSVLRITAKQAGAIIGIYYTFSDSSFASKDQSKSASIVIYGADGSAAKTFSSVAGSNKVAYYTEYQMNVANETQYVGSSGSRLVIMGFTIKQGQAAQTYTVKYMDGSTTLNTQTMASGDKVQYTPAKWGYNFEGWYTNSGLTAKYDTTAAVTANLTLYAKFTAWDSNVISNPYSLDATLVGKLAESYTSFSSDVELTGTIYTVLNGCQMQTSSGNNCVGTSGGVSKTQKGIKIEVPAAGTISILATSAGTSARNAKLLDESGNEVTAASGNVAWDADAAKAYEQRTLTYTVTEGTYFFGGSNGMRVFTCLFEEEVVEEPETPQTGLQITVESQENEATDTMLQGEEIRFIATIKGLAESDLYKSTGHWSFTLTDGSGKSRTSEGQELSVVYTSITGWKNTATNTYYAIYTLKGFNESLNGYKVSAQLTINDTYTAKSTDRTINVYSPEYSGLQLYQYSPYKGSSSSAGNSQYVNGSLKTVYTTSDKSLNTNYAYGILDNGNVLEASKLTFSGFNSGVTGAQKITVSYGDYKTTYTIYVGNSSSAYKDSDGNYVCTVDNTYTGTIGAINGTNGNMFNTIGQALQFLSNTTIVPSSANKILNITAGYYNEKLEITTPNLTIIGAGYTTGTYSKDQNYNNSTYKTATIIEWDSLYGIADKNGFSHVTDSTQTVAVRDTAVNCTIKNVTISNAYNCTEYFDAKLGTGYKEHRALALLVQSDQFILSNSSLLGYQDTVEFFKGRQYIENSFISGTTDFIFGTNNTTLFENCTIHSIYNGSSDGGYITAFKGYNKGEADYVNYGCIFYKSKFTADSDVSSGKTALGRPWAAYAAVAYIECTMDAHISKTAYSSGTSKNQRYVSMSGTEPTASTIKFYEYGNTGSGAISSAVNGMKMLSSSEAAKYYNYSVIFGTSNGKVTYNTAWNPKSTTQAKDNSTYYYWNGGTSATGIVYSGNYESYQGSKGTLGDITLNASSGKIQHRDSNDLMVTSGAKIEFSVTAGTLVTVESYPGYYHYKINGTEAGGDTVQVYYDNATSVTIESNGSTFYLYSITINSSADPLTVSLDSLKIEKYTANYEVGDSFDSSNLVVKAIYSNNTTTTLTSSQYNVDLSGVNFSKAGQYTVKVTYSGKSASFTINVVAAGTDTSVISQSTTISFGTNGNYSTYTGTGQLVMSGSGAKIQDNGGNNSQVYGTMVINVLKGAKITISSYNNYTHYQVGIDSTSDLTSEITGTSYEITVTSDSKVYLVCAGQNYFYDITITY